MRRPIDARRLKISPPDVPFIGSVKALCHVVLQQPVQPVPGPIQPPELGKLYEEIVALALACRVAACDGEVTLGRLLHGGGPTAWMTGLADVSVVVPCERPATVHCCVSGDQYDPPQLGIALSKSAIADPLVDRRKGKEGSCGSVAHRWA